MAPSENFRNVPGYAVVGLLGLIIVIVTTLLRHT